MCAPLPDMSKKAWEVLGVSKGQGGQYYMELCDGDGCRREPIDPYQATLLLATIAKGQSIYATELPKDEEEE